MADDKKNIPDAGKVDEPDPKKHKVRQGNSRVMRSVRLYKKIR